LLSGTGTVDVEPTRHLLVRLEGRYDASSERVFPLLNTARDSQVTATLGVVASTD
ncbi:MAG: outer membrane beta-barrel protein, partial [Deltaproteobacteria bacterium]|nr:outer membrane beta-barrel protein [Deltaproteobacteria bacterium]